MQFTKRFPHRVRWHCAKIDPVLSFMPANIDISMSRKVPPAKAKCTAANTNQAAQHAGYAQLNTQFASERMIFLLCHASLNNQRLIIHSRIAELTRPGSWVRERIENGNSN
jgi:hypothetical protein